MGPGRVRTQNPEARRERFLKFDLEIEWACDAGTLNGLGRLTCSIAIERPRVFTRPGPQADSSNQYRVTPLSPEWSLL
jgi:hypothetical protein